MTSIDLHPEELIDRARRGEASPDELRRLNEHLASCTACSFERALARDSDREGAPEPEEIGRIAQASVSALLARSTKRSSPRSSRRLVLAAAATVSIATAATAAILVERSLRAPVLPSEPAAATKGLPRLERPGAPAVAPAPPPSAAQAALSSAPPAAQAIGSLSNRTAPSADPPAGGTAAELFAQANAERRRGELGRAVEHYRDLQRTFPGSAEALVSRVTLGRLLLDRLANPAGALAEFDAYLARSSHGALREEALIGRALALGRLGRRAEERGAWHALLTGYPSSAYAGRARERLERLRTP
jgi:hypothetical protein